MGTRNPANPATPTEPRRTLHAMLLDARAALLNRITHNAALAHHLAEVLNVLPVKRLTTYWPTQGEFDALTVLGHWLAADAMRHAPLPVVTDKFSSLQFRRWISDCEMTPDTYNIPVPRSDEMGTPDALLTPCVGFDAQRYRIGYGGGFYDRMLVALHAVGYRPRTIGVAYEVDRVESIAPRSHDITMDCIVTERSAF